MKYSLVHVTTGGEYQTPLVASQLFDQAEIQSACKNDHKPEKVSAWIIEPLRTYFDSKSIHKLKYLKNRCKQVDITLICGINRLGNFPVMFFMILKRLLLGKSPVIYHCRGDAALRRVAGLKKIFPQDKFILDVRGYWPAEALYKNGITDINNLSQSLKDKYQNLSNNLTQAILRADGVCSVSTELIDLLKNKHQLVKPSWVVPCCIKEVTFNKAERQIKRKELGYAEEDIIIVYSGTTAKYQHLEDMCLPLMKALSEKNNHIKLLFLTPDQEVMRELIVTSNITKYQLLSVSQEQVASYLSAADFGVLLRKPTLVNQVANPVKIAEYLAAGLGIIMQNRCVSTGISTSTNAIIKIDILSPDTYENEIIRLDEIIRDLISQNIKQEASLLCEQKYLWKNTIQIHRNYYQQLLKAN